MRRAFLPLLLTLPLLGQLPAGTSRITFGDELRDAYYLAATGEVLWVGSIPDRAVERVELGGASTLIAIPPIWPFTSGLVAGPDGALWLTSPGGWLARVDPATNTLQRWPVGPGVGTSILSGPDGNIWLLHGRNVMRARPDGVFLSTYDMGGEPTGAVFGDDGALYLAFPAKLTRITVAGERTDFPASPRRALFAAAGFLWSVDARSRDEAVRTPIFEIVKMSYRGETLATYRLEMSPIASDAFGNLWLRATTAAGDVVAKLTPSGVLTRFGPLPSPLTTDCHPRSYGGLVFLPDGRVAMTDYYIVFANPLLSPCLRVPRPEAAKNTITLLDPRVAPVLSIEALDGSTRRRSARR